MAKHRKIPVRHHHGVRDPLKQNEQIEKKLKNVTNNPPERGDQKVSRKFMQFKDLVDAAKNGRKLPKRLSAGKEDLPRPLRIGKGKELKQPLSANKVKFVKQLPGEEDSNYLRRINRITRESLQEAHYEAKYGVRVIRNAKTGEIKIEKKPKNEIDELLKKKQKERLLAKQGKLMKNNRKPKVEEEKIDSKTAKELIKQALKEEKEEKKANILEEFQRDHIKFGEVVHAPPTLKTLPRKAEKADTVPRPGKKKNLLLQSLLTDNSTESVTKKKKSTVQRVTKAQLKGKRKELPEGTRNMLEIERSKFVELYRNLKKNKQISTNALK